MARYNRRTGGRACAQKNKAQAPTKIPKVKAETKAVNALLRKNPETLSPSNLTKIASFLRVSSRNLGKPKKFKGNASKLAKRRRERTRSVESDGASTSSRDENQNSEVSMNGRQGKKASRRSKSSTEPIGKRLTLNFLRQNMKKVRWDEDSSLIESERRVRTSIANDPELRGFYTRKISSKITYSQMKTMGRVIEMVLITGDDTEVKVRGTEDITIDQKLLDYIKKEVYVPPANRIQVIAEKSNNWKTDVPVYTDLPKEDPQTSNPSTLVIQYSNENFYDKRKYAKLEKVSKTILKCDCCTEDAITKCYNNPNCPCYKRNVRLRGLQTVQDKVAHTLTKFSTFEPIHVRNNDSFYDTLGFACSEECGCKGKCNNNVTLLLEKKIHELELFRKNEILGFAIRTKTAIPCGTPVMEFVGEIGGNKANNNYEYAAFHKEEDFSKIISAAFDGSEKRIMEETMKALSTRKSWYINPEEIGNLGRFCSHSCEPNLAMVRVFQKGFTPAHCRFLLVTQEVIFPGMELTFDYGQDYIRDNLNDNCLCGKPSCKSSDLYDMMRNASESSLEMYLSIRYHTSYHNFKNNVLDKIDE